MNISINIIWQKTRESIKQFVVITEKLSDLDCRFNSSHPLPRSSAWHIDRKLLSWWPMPNGLTHIYSGVFPIIYDNFNITRSAWVHDKSKIIPLLHFTFRLKKGKKSKKKNVILNHKISNFVAIQDDKNFKWSWFINWFHILYSCIFFFLNTF